MEETKEKSKLTVVQGGNPRGGDVSKDELQQSITDISTWFKANAADVAKTLDATKPASKDEIERLRTKVLKTTVPISLQTLLETYNGNFLLKDNYRSMSVSEIEDSVEVNQVNGHWNKDYIPFAVDDEKNYLCIHADTGSEKKVISWCTDIGVIEDVADSLGLLLEKARDGLLKKKVQYVEGAGLVEDTE